MRQPCDRHDDRYQRHSDDGTLFCTVCEIERLRADLTRVLDMLRRAYDAMRSEYGRTGHIGHGDEHHDEYCERPNINLSPPRGHRIKAVAAKLKELGVRRGVPDIWLPVPRGIYHGLVIEMKAGRNKTTPEQAEWIRALGEHGYRADVARSWEQAKDQIVSYLSQPVPNDVLIRQSAKLLLNRY